MKAKIKWLKVALVIITIFTLPRMALAYDIGKPDPEVVKGLYPGKAYSPYAQRRFPDQVLWGDTHLHTGLSMDAGLFGARLGLDDAYRFARGEEVVASSGQPVRLGRPLDWLVVAEREGAGFGDFQGTFTPLVNNELLAELTESSSYFQLKVVVQIATVRIIYFSTLQRGATGQVVPILRSLGTT